MFIIRISQNTSTKLGNKNALIDVNLRSPPNRKSEVDHRGSKDLRKNESDLPDTRSPRPICSTRRPVARPLCGPAQHSPMEKQETNCSISDRPAWASTCGNHRARRGVLSGPRSERSDLELTDWLAVYLRCTSRVVQGDVSLYRLLPCVPWRATGRKGKGERERGGGDIRTWSGRGVYIGMWVSVWLALASLHMYCYICTCIRST